MKLRTFPNEMMRWSLEAMGFTIQIMPLPEVFLAIQQGAVQGQENPIDTIYSNKFYEVAPNITLTNHVYSPIPLAISEKTWAKMSPADQKAVTEAASIAGKFSRDMIAGNDDNQLKEMAAKGLRQGAREVRRRRRQGAGRSRDHPQDHEVRPCRRRRCSSRWPRRRCPCVCSGGRSTGW
jgi:TRAP-type C4-dicarboxylate transport system substrate-binding protein